MIKKIKSKQILSPLKKGNDKIFGMRYSMNLYRGCQHNCIYCDSRSDCYQIENFSDILVKENAIELLKKELKSKKRIETIGTGSMNDPYMPVEKDYKLTREALKVIARYKFPIHIVTKGDLILRDIDILKKINKTYAAISVTITTSDDKISKKIEPAAPKSSRRFEVVKQLTDAGLYVGIFIMPMIPFITDTKENIEKIVKEAKRAGAKYIICWVGLTMRSGQREYFYKELDKKFPNLKEKYIEKYKNKYVCLPDNSKELYEYFKKLCKQERIATRINFYKPKDGYQMSLKGFMR